MTGDLLVGAKGATVRLDHLAFCSADGTELADGLPTGRADVPTGWFPPKQVQSLARAANLAFVEQEITTAHELRDEFPRLIPHEGLYVGLVRANEIMYLLFGLAALVVAVVVLAGHRWWLGIGAFLGAVVFCALGVLFDPKVMQRFSTRPKRHRDADLR